MTLRESYINPLFLLLRKRIDTCTTPWIGEGLLVKNMIMLQLLYILISCILTPCFCSSWLQGGMLYHMSFLANIGPQKFLNWDTSLTEKGRFCNMMGASPKHQTYITFLAMVIWCGHQVSGGRTTYHICI